MVDTVGIWISEQSIPHLDLLAELPLRLSSFEEKKDKIGRVYFKGKLENLQVKVNEEGASIIGSIPKSMYGNNFQMTDRKTIYQFCEKCSDSLHLKVGKGHLFRLDMGLNIQTNHAPSLYYPYLGNLQYFKRLEQPDGFRYDNIQRKLAIYDKIKEAKAHRHKIPLRFNGMQIMRLEYRLSKGKAIKSFLPGACQLENLYEKGVFNEMRDSVKGIYKQIHKVHEVLLEKESIHTRKDFKKQLEAIGMYTLGGYDKTLDLAKEINKCGYLNCYKSYGRIREDLQKLERDYCDSYPNQLIQELNEKIEAFAIMK